MSSPTIRVGFIGLSKTGWAANALAPALLSLPDKYSLVSLSTRTPESAAVTAEKYSREAGKPVKAYHGNSSNLANDPNIDLVIVSVKTPSHLATVLPVIEAGKNVFLEWPVGASIKETSQILEAARAKGIRTIAGLQARQSKTIQKVKELIDSGKIGRVLSSNFTTLIAGELAFWGPRVKEAYLYTLEKNPEGDIPVYDVLLGHQLDAVTYILGPYASVAAAGITQYPTTEVVDDNLNPTGKQIHSKSPDHIAFSGIFKSGAISSYLLRGGQAATPGRTALTWEIDGEVGSIRLEYANPKTSPLFNIREPNVYLNGEPLEISSQSGLIPNLVAGFEEYAKGEKEGHYATFEDALQLRRLLDAISRSAEQGRTVSL